MQNSLEQVWTGVMVRSSKKSPLIVIALAISTIVLCRNIYSRSSTCVPGIRFGSCMLCVHHRIRKSGKLFEMSAFLMIWVGHSRVCIWFETNNVIRSVSDNNLLCIRRRLLYSLLSEQFVSLRRQDPYIIIEGYFKYKRPRRNFWCSFYIR